MIFKKLLFVLILLFAILFYISCKKSDTFSSTETVNKHSIEKDFFETHRTTDPTEKVFVEFLKRLNDKEHFVEKTVERIGYPQWNKAFTTPKKNIATSFQSNLQGDSTETYYIPFVKDSQNFVDAAMIIKASQTDTSFSYKVACGYGDKNNTANSISDDAEYYTVFFMVMDKRVFGYNKFKPAIPELFKANGHVAKELTLTSAAANPFYNNLFDVIGFVKMFKYHFLPVRKILDIVWGQAAVVMAALKFVPLQSHTPIVGKNGSIPVVVVVVVREVAETVVVLQYHQVPVMAAAVLFQFPLIIHHNHLKTHV
ncbi:MAG: hypothetical protein QM737_16035 [Ferruginibacter sp.]